MIRAIATVLVAIGIFIYVENSKAAVPLPPTPPPVLLENCPIMPRPACTFPGGPVYLGTNPSIRTLWHELGHQFDYQAMHEPQRDKFRELVGDLRSWWAGPYEQFAVAYSICARPVQVFAGHIGGPYGYDVTKRRHRRICTLIRNAGIIAGAKMRGRGPESPASRHSAASALAA